MKDYSLLKSALAEVDAKRVRLSKLDDLMLFKYDNDCVFDKAWNNINKQCRGLIFREDGEIIARPFGKFWNINEMPETHIDNLPGLPYSVEEKIDGSLGIFYRHQGQPKLATPGSFESDQALEGTKLLGEYRLEYIPVDTTPLFEIIYPTNRIVVDYKGQSKLVLLAVIGHNGQEWHSNRVNQLAERCEFERPKIYHYSDLANLPFSDNSEGYVIHFENHFRVKIKSPLYVRIHRLLNFLSPKGVIDLIRGSEYGTILEQLPHEIQKDFDDIRASVMTQFYNHQNRIRDLFAEIPQSVTRKEQALMVKAKVPDHYKGFMFSLLDGRDISDQIWKLILEELK